jgi:prephenate dehydrogenase
MSAKLPFSRVCIIGSGLIGTSIGLALSSKGASVTMLDQDSRTQGIAQALMGNGGGELSGAELVIAAIPVSAFPMVITTLERATFKGVLIDVTSIKAKPVLDVANSSLSNSQFLPTHPMAGREFSGAESARADLFEGRPWMIDSTGVDQQAVAWGKALIESLGAQVIDMPATDHDQAVALVSHLPQLISSLLAKQLAGKPAGWLELSGGGLRDTTRIAASDAGLWKEIIAANSGSITPLLKSLAADLNSLISNIESESFIAGVIKDGQEGRALIPGKHGGKAREYTHLPIVIEDKPGQLAAIFDECAKVSVNIEDLSIEHSPGQETGLITLAVSHSDAPTLKAHLESQGWDVHAPRS